MPDQPGTARAAVPDPAIEALYLSATAKSAAYQLKAAFPTIEFTSGRRDKAAQASAMASNVVLNRNWIRQTYMDSDAIRACQGWVDQHPQVTTKADLAAGLLSVLNSLTDEQLSHVSKHLSGDAFDVQPVDDNADAIVQFMRDLTQRMGGKFLDHEGGLRRWHAQF